MTATETASPVGRIASGALLSGKSHSAALGTRPVQQTSTSSCRRLSLSIWGCRFRYTRRERVTAVYVSCAAVPHPMATAHNIRTWKRTNRSPIWSDSMSLIWRYRRAAMRMPATFWPVHGYSGGWVATAVTEHNSAPSAGAAQRPVMTGRFRPIPTCCYMIWVKDWRTTGRRVLPTAVSGVPRRYGELV